MKITKLLAIKNELNPFSQTLHISFEEEVLKIFEQIRKLSHFHQNLIRAEKRKA